MAKTLCKIIGLVLLVVGLFGFFKPDLLGMHLTVVHNVIHLLTGALASYFGFAGSSVGARTFSLVFGGVYALLGVLGFVAPGVVAGLLQAHEEAGSPTPTMAMDSAVHLLLGAAFLVAGLMSGRGSSQAGS